MIRSFSKCFIPLSSNNGGPVCLSRLYITSSRDLNHKRFASGGNQPPRRFGRFFIHTTVGITLIVVGGVVVYAKSDPKFRKVLDSYVPGSDNFIRIIYQEEGSFNIDFTEQLSKIQDKVISIPNNIYKQIAGTASEESPSILPKAKELTSKEHSKPKPKPAVDKSKKTIAVFEVSGAEGKEDAYNSASDALKIYNDLISSIEDKSNEIVDLIDGLDESSDSKKTWNEISDKMQEYKKYNEGLCKLLDEAGEKAKKFFKMMKEVDESGSSSEEAKSLNQQLIKAKEKAEGLKKNKLAASLKYFTKIEETLKRSSDELTTLFPDYKPGDKRLKLPEEKVDLFLYYTFHKLLYYQKELDKMEAAVQQKLKKAISSKDDAQLLDSAVESRVEEAKRKIKEDFDKKMEEMKQGCDEEVNNSLKRQEQVHLDLLNDQLALKEKEVERKLIEKMDQKLMEEQAKLQAELADMTARMQGLNEAIAKRSLQDQKAQTSQALWSAAEALYDTLKHGGGEEITPLKDNVQAVQNASAKGDDLVETVVATIPSVAVERGVYPEDALRERFKKVEEVAWRVAGVPEGGASLPKLLMAWLQSLLIIKTSDPIPTDELNNKPFDPSSLNNYDILQRARYYVDQGDFEQALKYMNLLKGGARAVSSDWMKEATTLLETQQAANLLLAHASASGMIYS